MEKLIGFMLMPVFAFLLLLAAYPVKRLVQRKMPDSKLKRLLLHRFNR